MRSKYSAYLAALSMSIIIGFSFLASKVTLESASPWAILAHRFTFSFLSLLLLKVLGLIRVTLTMKEFLHILPLSIFFPLWFFTFQILGLQTVTSSEAAIIQAIIPLLTMVLATLILKEKTGRIQKVFMLVSLAGVLYISFMGGDGFSGEGLTGYVLLLLSSLSSAVNFVLIRKYVARYHYLKLTSVGIISGFIVFNCINLFLHLSAGTMESYFSPLKVRSFLLGIVFLGTLSTLGSSLLSNFALSRLEASRISIFNHLTTVISILAGVVLLKESLMSYQILGAVLIILGVIGTNYYSPAHQKRISGTHR